MTFAEIREDMEDQLAAAWAKEARLRAMPTKTLRAMCATHRDDAWPGHDKAAGRLSVMWQVEA